MIVKEKIVIVNLKIMQRAAHILLNHFCFFKIHWLTSLYLYKISLKLYSKKAGNSKCHGGGLSDYIGGVRVRDTSLSNFQTVLNK